ncbi:MAG: hypothetical protein QGF16_01050, partial [Rhodospirillales bacterium]|jgi:hypothetical protein|nr:hypothetical protein [Rhodospirillales bacterium]
MIDISRLKSSELLALHASVGEELRGRGIVRSSNNPVGDLAEYLFCKAFDCEQAPNSEMSYDARARDGTRYQIKGRRPTKHSKSRQLSILRDLDQAGFEFLAGVIFNEDYSVFRAAIIPHSTVLPNSRFNAHSNGWVFLLNDATWDWDGVKDVTDQLRAVKL